MREPWIDKIGPILNGVHAGHDVSGRRRAERAVVLAAALSSGNHESIFCTSSPQVENAINLQST
jgi:hypothetical protein